MDREGSPRDFTCLLPVFGRDDPCAFEEAFQSVVGSTLPPKALFICQDGPIPSELFRVIARCAEYPSVTILKNDGPPGLHNNLNHAADHVETPWICRADADDINHPNRFELQVAFLESHPEISAVGTEIMEFWPDGRTRLKEMPTDNRSIRRHCIYRNPINHMTAFFSTRAFRRSGAYPTIPLKEDYALWLAMIANGYQLANIPRPLVQVRLGQDFYRRRRGYGQIESELRLYRYRRAVPEGGAIRAAAASVGRALILSSEWAVKHAYEGFLR